MKLTLKKAAVIGGACALFVSAGTMVFAQSPRDFDGGPGQYAPGPDARGFGPQDPGFGADRDGARHEGTWNIGRERHELTVLHAVYDHEAASGHYYAAEQAHLRARAIRAHLRAQRDQMQPDRPDFPQDGDF